MEWEMLQGCDTQGVCDELLTALHMVSA